MISVTQIIFTGASFFEMSKLEGIGDIELQNISMRTEDGITSFSGVVLFKLPMKEENYKKVLKIFS